MLRLKIIGIAAVLLGVAGGIWFAWRTAQSDMAPTSDAAPHVETAAGQSDPLAPGMVRFVHPRYGFSLDFPDSLGVTRYPQGNASETDVFAARDTMDTTTPRFQLFITPYAEATITPARLAKDIPNHDIRETQEAMIGIGNAIHAAIFRSSDPSSGEETREVWFIHNGFIFEVTVPFSDDAWMAGVMKTFLFK